MTLTELEDLYTGTLSFLTPQIFVPKLYHMQKGCHLSKCCRLHEIYHSHLASRIPLHLFLSSPNNPELVEAFQFTTKQSNGSNLFTSNWQHLIYPSILKGQLAQVLEVFRPDTSFYSFPSKDPSKRKKQLSSFKKSLVWHAVGIRVARAADLGCLSATAAPSDLSYMLRNAARHLPVLVTS